MLCSLIEFGWFSVLRTPDALLALLPSSARSSDFVVCAHGLSPCSSQYVMQLDSSDEDIAIVSERPMQPGSSDPMGDANGHASNPVSAGKECWHPFWPHALSKRFLESYSTVWSLRPASAVLACNAEVRGVQRMLDSQALQRRMFADDLPACMSLSPFSAAQEGFGGSWKACSAARDAAGPAVLQQPRTRICKSWRYCLACCCSV